MSGDLALVRRLVAADAGLAVVAASRGDGSVHASLVNAGVLDDPLTGEPAVGLVTRGASAKATLIRAAGRASVTFRSGWEWAGVEGPVTLIGPDDVPAGFDPAAVPQLLRDVFEAAGGTHEDWDDYDRTMAAERRLAILVQPVRILSNG